MSDDGESGAQCVTVGASRFALESSPCDICGVMDEEFLYTKAGTITGYPFRLVRCRRCSLMYLNPRLGQADIAKLYDQRYYAGEGFDPHVRYIRDFSMESDQDKLFHPEMAVQEFEQLVHPPARLLDFGCGLGDLVRDSKKRGYDAMGYEVSAFASDFAASNGLQIYGRMDEIPSDTFDIVTAIEVLEHCSSPMRVLETIYRCLKKGGCFYYTTQNFDGFYRQYRRGQVEAEFDGYVVPEGHIHFFNTAVMTTYFGIVGFSRVFPFESAAYAKDSRVYRLLKIAKIIQDPTSERPTSLMERACYYGGRKLAKVLRRSERRRLPIARK